jgi:LmbE family N-acetylglucosaminyl deacetylase
MKRLGAAAVCLLLAAGSEAQQIRVIAIGAHPDDCDIGAAGTAAKFAQLGHAVKFLSCGRKVRMSCLSKVEMSS